jgi:hypothetical protein
MQSAVAYGKTSYIHLYYFFKQHTYNFLLGLFSFSLTVQQLFSFLLTVQQKQEK